MQNDTNGFIAEMAGKAGNLGVEAAEIAGQLAEITSRSESLTEETKKSTLEIADTVQDVLQIRLTACKNMSQRT